MRVGIDAHAIGSEQSGNETYYEQLLKHLAVTPTNGNRYVIYYTNPAGAERIPTSEKFHLKRLWPATHFGGFPLVFRSSSKERNSTCFTRSISYRRFAIAKR